MTVKNESMTDGKTANYALERDKGACPGKARASSKCEATYTTKQGDYAFEAYVARRHEPPSRVADDGRWKHPKCSINGAWHEMIGERAQVDTRPPSDETDGRNGSS